MFRWGHIDSHASLPCVAFLTKLICCMALGTGFSIEATAQNIRFFDIQSDYSPTSANVFMQSSSGFLYFASRTGLYVSSGGAFTRVDKQDGTSFAEIDAMAADLSGNVLVADKEGLWLDKGDGFTPVQLPAKGNLRLAANADGFFVLVGNGPAQGGSLWRLKRYSEKRFELVPVVRANDPDEALEPLSTQPLLAMSAAGKALWFGCGQALCRFENGRADIFDTAHGVPADEWKTLTVAKDRTLFARSGQKLVVIPEQGNAHVEDIPYPAPHYFTEHPDRLFLNLSANGILLTPGGENIVFRQTSGQWDVMRWPAGNVSNHVSAAFTDREYGIWLGSPGQGIARLAGFPFWETFFPRGGDVPRQVINLRHDSAGRRWIAAQNGVFEYGADAGGGFSLLRHFDFEPGGPLLRAGNGSLWTTEKGKGPIRIDTSSGTIRSFQLSSPATGALAIDSSGRIWVGTADGLKRIDNSSEKSTIFIEAPELRGHRVNSLCFDQFGRLFVLTDDVLYEQDTDRERFTPRIDLSRYDLGAGKDMATTMSNEIWVVGSSGAIRKVLLPEDDAASVGVLDSGPKNFGINTVFRDSRGWMWIGGERGIDVLSPDGWRHYDADGGLRVNRIALDAISEDDDGSMWFGNGDDFVHLKEPAALPDLPSLETSIVSARLGNVDLLGTPQGWDDSDQDLMLHFATPTFVGSEALRFSFQLSGIDAHEREQNSPFAAYKSLRTRKILFQVQGIDPLNYRNVGSAVLAASPAGVSDLSSVRFFWWGSGVVLAVSAFGGWFVQRRRQKNRGEIEAAVNKKTRVMQETEKQLRRQSRVDGLTGLLNRHTIMEELTECMRRPEAVEHLAVALLDIDHFKAINDTYGHQCGDYVLEQYSHRLRQAAGQDSEWGRYGGEELIVIFKAVSSAEELARHVTAIHEHLRAPLTMKDKAVDLVVTCSIGVAISHTGETPTQLIGRADRALYRGKRTGRNCVMFAE